MVGCGCRGIVPSPSGGMPSLVVRDTVEVRFMPKLGVEVTASRKGLGLGFTPEQVLTKSSSGAS